MVKQAAGQQEESTPAMPEDDDFSIEDSSEEFFWTVAGAVQDFMENAYRKWSPLNISDNTNVLFNSRKKVYDGDTVMGIAAGIKRKAVDKCRREHDGMGRHEAGERIDTRTIQKEEAQ